MPLFSLITLCTVLLLLGVSEIIFCKILLDFLSKGWVVLFVSLINFLIVIIVIRFIQRDQVQKKR
jgi:hypothetical protein